MQTTRCGGLLGIALSAVVLVSTPTHAAQQPDAKPAASNTVAGQWRLSKPAGEPGENSSSTTKPEDEPERSEGRGGRRPGGFGGGGYGGGRGGFGGGRGGDAIGGGFNSDQMAAMRAAMREAGQTPDILNIVVSGDVVSFTTDQGVVRRFTANGKKEKIELGDVKVDCVTSWNHDTLTQEMKAGGATITRTWQVVTDGQQLAITISTTGDRMRGDGPQVRKVLYDRNARTSTGGTMIGGF